VRLEVLDKLKNPPYPVLTGDLSAYSILPQLTTLPRAPHMQLQHNTFEALTVVTF
jgi:hypothetical protein